MTEFARRIYKIVLDIPLGQTRSYKWVAAKAGRPRAARSVGTILKNNPLPLIIPCHRVVKSNKDAGGYVYGVKAKKELLKLETEMLGCLRNRK
jgi:methylated-DNA-[protein]-cysteine S-methyltransferase